MHLHSLTAGVIATSTGLARVPGSLTLTSTATQVDVLPVLSFVAQHLMAPRDICNSLQVCKSWKGRLAKSHSSLVVYLTPSSSDDMAQLAVFTSWMQQYGSLVQKLFLEHEEDAAQVVVAETLLIQALQLAAAKGVTLQIQEVHKSGLYCSSFLSSLPVAPLTSLNLNHISSSKAATIRALASGLGCLTGLRSLSLSGVLPEGEVLPAFPASSLSGLQQLTNLRKLTLSGLAFKWEVGTEQHFPQQLQCECQLFAHSPADQPLQLGAYRNSIADLGSSGSARAADQANCGDTSWALHIVPLASYRSQNPLREGGWGLGRHIATSKLDFANSE